jgi:putative transposase
MAESIKRRRWSMEVWRELSARQVASGLSVGAFCARESINLSSFYRGRERWGNDEVPAQCAATQVAVPASSSQAAFVNLGSLRSGASSLSLRLDLGEGLVLCLERH